MPQSKRHQGRRVTSTAGTVVIIVVDVAAMLFRGRGVSNAEDGPLLYPSPIVQARRSRFRAQKGVKGIVQRNINLSGRQECERDVSGTEAIAAKKCPSANHAVVR